MADVTVSISGLETSVSANAPPTHNQKTHENQESGDSTKEGYKKFGLLDVLVIFIVRLGALLVSPIMWITYIFVVRQYERAVVFRLGKLAGPPQGPGVVTYLPCIDDARLVDMRTRTFDVPLQEVLTSDSVTITVDAVVFTRVYDAEMSVSSIKNVYPAIKMLAQTTIRNFIGSKRLTDILTERDEVAMEVSDILDSATERWGVKVERIEIKDVHLPRQLQRAMAAEAEASREAKAMVIAAEGEARAAQKLRMAADEMGKSPNSLQLRYLQTLTAISAEKQSTIVFPVPIQFMPK